MRQITTTAFLGMLALTITGCPSSEDQQSVSPAPSPSTVPVAVPTPLSKPPLVAQNPTSAAYLAPGLIQPTNANQRTKQVAKGNRDPFAALFLPVPVAPTNLGNSSPYGVGSSPYANSPARTQSPQVAGSPTVSSGQTTRTQTSRNANNQQSVPGSIAIRNAPNQGSSSTTTITSPQNIPLPPNGMLPNNNLQPALPPPALPEPDVANKVMVMGVIQIGEQTQAIVQVPSEATSRYVQVGQRLSNGQVLVKRIELNAGAEPLVVLEQYGVEVSKAVGEQTPNPEQQTTPTAMVPYLPPQTNISTATIPAPPQNINVESNISFPSLPPAPITAAK